MKKMYLCGRSMWSLRGECHGMAWQGDAGREDDHDDSEDGNDDGNLEGHAEWKL